MGVSTDERNDSQSALAEHIHSESYKAKLREKFMDCVHRGQDMSVDCNGNLMLVETKLVFHSFIWNSESNCFEKASNARCRSKKRRDDLGADMDEDNVMEECSEELESQQEI